jgi:hypothetical protein|tara:strand:- start:191 stop:514 length:324 start_codon:yes stop_codon:yes gene_type:complete
MKKQFNLYTFTVGKFCSTETDSLEQAISNFNRRLNLDYNGYHHPNMNYNFEPIRIITEQKINDEIELDRCNSETILKFNMNKLNHLILSEQVEQPKKSKQLEFNFNG